MEEYEIKMMININRRRTKGVKKSLLVTLSVFPSDIRSERYIGVNQPYILSDIPFLLAISSLCQKDLYHLSLERVHFDINNAPSPFHCKEDVNGRSPT